MEFMQPMYIPGLMIDFQRSSIESIVLNSSIIRYSVMITRISFEKTITILLPKLNTVP